MLIVVLMLIVTAGAINLASRVSLVLEQDQVSSTGDRRVEQDLDSVRID